VLVYEYALLRYNRFQGYTVVLYITWFDAHRLAIGLLIYQ